MENIYTALVFPLLLLIGQTLVAIGQRKVNRRMDESERKRDEAHAETRAKRDQEAQWRETVDKLLSEQSAALSSVAQDRVDWYAWREEIVKMMDAQDERIDTILTAQCSQMRSDIIHKCHRYLDDLGKASTEEKDALKAEHEEYSAVCQANGIVNNFVDMMVQRVMELPERDV